MMLTTIRIVLDMIAAMTILVCCYIAWEWMSHMTRHRFRFVYGVIGLSALAVLVAPVLSSDYEDYLPFFKTSMLVGFALYMILDRRRIKHNREAKR